MVALRLLIWSTLSSTPVTVTVCPVAQLEAVKVSVAGLTVTAVTSSEATVMRTSPAGALPSVTV